MKEWLEHYLYHGIDHFYLINDASTDNFLEILQPYIDKGVVTLFNANIGYYLGRQRNMYNKFILPCIHETKWLLMMDLDEYVWSRESIDINTIFKQLDDIGQIQIRENLFGSNGHTEQPSTIVNSFTKRKLMGKQYDGPYKYAINTSFKFTSLNVHHATFEDKQDELNHFIILTNPHLMYNHYNCQSLQFWKEVKMTRGDSDNYRERTVESFKELDKNDVEDFELLEQNKNITPFL